MAEQNELKPTVPAGTPVPDLIEQYRVRRDAWIAQADELARLRDEVRGSAEREAMEIVTVARRDVRQIVMEARRELLVLSAQVQAALGEGGARPDPTALLNRARERDGSSSDSEEFSDSVFVPEEAVKSMLDDARADMDALVEDARTVPFQALAEAQAPVVPHAVPIFPVEEPEDAPHETVLLAVPRESMFREPALLHAPLTPSTSSLSANASRVLLSSPFPSDSVPVQPGRRVRTFVTLFGVAGVAVLLGTFWWLRPSVGSAVSASPAAKPTASAAKTADAAPAATTPSPAPAPAVAAGTPSDLSLVVQARRSSWIRTTVDGESDNGRTFADGETVQISAQRSVGLRVGDAGAVYVSVNKGEARPLGRDGQVVTRQFVVESTNRPADSQPQTVTPVQKSAPFAPPIASAPTSLPPGPAAVPLVQPVAATPAPPPDPAPASSPARAERPETTPPVAPRAELPVPGLSSPASAVIAASRQWLDAYQRQDRATMTSLSTDGLQLADERRTEERFPASVDVSRTLDRVSVQIAADTAVLTAVMTERSADGGAAPRVSPVSQVWVLNGNQWRVRQVRLVSEARLNQIFR